MSRHLCSRSTICYTYCISIQVEPVDIVLWSRSGVAAIPVKVSFDPKSGIYAKILDVEGAFAVRVVVVLVPRTKI